MPTVNGIVAETKEGQGLTPVASEWSAETIVYEPLPLKKIVKRWIAPSLALCILSTIVFLVSAHLLPIALLGALGLFIAQTARFKRDPVEFTDRDRVLLHEATEGQFLVNIEIRQDKFLTGSDRGVMWLEDGRLVFSGQRSSFILRPDDLTPDCLNCLVKLHAQGNPLYVSERLTLKGEGAILEVKIHRIPIPIQDTLATEESRAVSERLRTDEIERSILATTMSAFARGSNVPGSSQYPPTKFDPLVRFSLSPFLWPALSSLAIMSVALRSSFSRTDLLFLAIALLLIVGYEAYRAWRWASLRRRI